MKITSYSLSGVRTFQGRDGFGVNATLRLDGKPVATIHDAGDGGEIRIDFRDRVQQAPAFREAAAEWFRETGQPGKFGDDYFGTQCKVERWISLTVDEIETKKKFDRIAKRKTLFQLQGDPREEWRTIERPCDDDVQKFLEQKYGVQLTAIWGRAYTLQERVQAVREEISK